MFARTASGLALVALLVIAAAARAEKFDRTALPPEVAARMRPEIISGERPVILLLRREDIHGLRTAPRLNCDFVQLSINYKDLTSIQQAVLAQWLRGGYNRVLLRGVDMSLYAPLFELQGNYGGTRFVRLTLNEHVANTDCVTVEGNISLRKLPEGSETIATLNGEPACGAFHHGKSIIYFIPELRGTDAERWLLNFYHWSLGQDVPGASSAIVEPPPQPVSAPTNSIVLLLKNGDEISGEIDQASFAWEADGKRARVKREAIASIVIDASADGPANKKDRLTTRSGRLFGGLFLEDELRIRLPAGDERVVARDAIKVIRLGLPQAPRPTP